MSNSIKVSSLYFTSPASHRKRLSALGILRLLPCVQEEQENLSRRCKNASFGTTRFDHLIDTHACSRERMSTYWCEAPNMCFLNRPLTSLTGCTMLYCVCYPTDQKTWIFGQGNWKKKHRSSIPGRFIYPIRSCNIKKQKKLICQQERTFPKQPGMKTWDVGQIPKHPPQNRENPLQTSNIIPLSLVEMWEWVVHPTWIDHPNRQLPKFTDMFC